MPQAVLTVRVQSFAYQTTHDWLRNKAYLSNKGSYNIQMGENPHLNLANAGKVDKT